MKAIRRRRPQYRDLGLAIVLLVSLVIVAVGVAATRFGWMSVEVKIALGRGGQRRPTAGTATVVVPSASPVAPPRTPTASPLPDGPVPQPATASSAALAVETAEAPATLAGAVPSAAYTATALTSMSQAQRSRALAAAGAIDPRPCDASARPGNVDPTAGDISGTTGLPDQVTYFRHLTKSGCPSALRRSVATTPAK